MENPHPDVRHEGFDNPAPSRGHVRFTKRGRGLTPAKRCVLEGVQLLMGTVALFTIDERNAASRGNQMNHSCADGRRVRLPVKVINGS